MNHRRTGALEPVLAVSGSVRTDRPLLSRVAPSIVDRPRVSAFLDAAAAHPVAVIRAPRAAGKTIALITWLAGLPASSPETVFVTIDDETRDRTAFWRTVVQDLEDAGVLASGTAPVGRTVAWGFDGREGAPGRSPRSDLVRSFRGLREPVRLVIDDFHLIDDHALLRDLEAVVRAVPHVTLVVAAQAPTRFDDVDLIGEFDVAIVSVHELALTYDETRDVMVRASSSHTGLLDVDGAVVSATFAEAGGHPGMVTAIWRGLSAPGGPLRQLEASEAVLATTIAATALDYVRSLLARIDVSEGLADFLHRTCVVETLPVALAAELAETGVDECLRSLERCEAEGLGAFITLDRRASAEFRFAPVVRTAMRRDLVVSRPGLERSLVRRAALWALGHDRPMVAVQCAVDLVDVPLLATVVRAFWARLVSRHVGELAGVLAPLPRRRTQRHPSVLALTAMAFASAGVHAGRATLAHEAAIAAVRSRLASVSASERVFYLGLETQSRRSLGDINGAVGCAHQAEELIALLTSREMDDLRSVIPSISVQFAVTFFVAGETERAFAAFARANGFAEGPDEVMERSEIQNLTAFIHCLTGEVTTARRLLAVTTDDSPVTMRLLRAILALEDFDPRAAEAQLMRIDPLLGSYEYWPLVLSLRAWAALLRGRAAVVQLLPDFDAQIARYRLRSPADGELNILLGVSRARLFLATGRLERASAALDALPADAPSVLQWRSALTLTRGDASGALDLVLRGLATTGVDARTRISLTLMRAVCELRLERKDAARDDFAAALDLTETTGARGPLVSLPRDDLVALADDATTIGDRRGRRLVDGLTGLASGFPEVTVEPLSDREMVVLRRLSSGASLPLVATELHVSVNTVKTQLRSLYRKLGVADRRSAVEAALRQGLIGF